MNSAPFIVVGVQRCHFIKPITASGVHMAATPRCRFDCGTVSDGAAHSPDKRFIIHVPLVLFGACTAMMNHTLPGKQMQEDPWDPSLYSVSALFSSPPFDETPR